MSHERKSQLLICAPLYGDVIPLLPLEYYSQSLTPYSLKVPMDTNVKVFFTPKKTPGNAEPTGTV